MLKLATLPLQNSRRPLCIQKTAQMCAPMGDHGLKNNGGFVPLNLAKMSNH